MSEDPIGHDTPPDAGYLSEAAKRRFTITAGVLGSVFLIAQFLLPFALMFVVMATMSDEFKVDFSRRDPLHTALWDDAVWLIESTTGSKGAPETSVLVRAPRGGTADPETVLEGIAGKPYLLPNGDRLWLIDQTSVAYFEHGNLVTMEQTTALAEISMPFLLDGMPAVLERWPGELALVVYDGADWQHYGAIPLTAPEPECGCGLDWARAVADDRGIHVFLEFGSTLYYGLWKPDIGGNVVWERVTDSGRGWSPLIWHGEPAVFVLPSVKNGNSLLAIRRGGDGWVQVVDFGPQRGDVISVFREEKPDSLVFVVGFSYGRSVEVLTSDGHVIVTKNRIGEGPQDFGNLPPAFMTVMTVPYATMLVMPILLAVILSALMRRYRVTTFSSGSTKVRFASLSRRAIAQLIDLVIVVGPTIGAFASAWWRMMSGAIEDPSSLSEGMTIFGPMVVSLGWTFFAALVFTYTEGRSGVTPGKWITRIRVFGTDLQPCGFGRALVRNLLKFIDGFFNFMVGIMVAALSENWQRVGDMAARTIVVEWSPQDNRL